jgi:hypothetical protein
VTELDPRALEKAARALSELHIEASLENGSGWRVAAHRGARAAVTAYLDAMPPPVSPELIAGLNKLATYLTEQGEYEAVDLIDTVVARLTPLPAPPAAQDPRP